MKDNDKGFAQHPHWWRSKKGIMGISLLLSGMLSVWYFGYRDADGDGLRDRDDACPQQFGEIKDKGCPNYAAAELKAIRKIEAAANQDSLSLAGLGLTRLPSQVKKLTHLKKLNLSNNQFTGLTPLVNTLQGLKQLTTLELDSNKITNWNALKNLTQLSELSLKETGLSNITMLVPALKGLQALNVLDLSDNQIKNIAPLKALTQLTTLYLGSNAISDVSVLGALTQLTTLDLSSNGINNLSKMIAPLKAQRK